MGEVYRADDLHLGQPVALKFLPADVERDPVRLERLISEVRTARQISHPNLCRVYDIGEFEGSRFLSMEYIDGEDLRSLLRRIGRLSEDKGLQMARQLCAGLAAMHDRGVLHRDLKPANVMIDGEGRVRLTDFGLAAAVADGAHGEIAGTPAYMAPEQLAGGELTPQTDLYALGLVLLELFTGTPARSKPSGASLDPAIPRVIERCLDEDPRKRPASAIAVAAALPGGDPLAAALAAGETPSPQLVAAAGGEGRLPATIGVPLLIAFLVMAATSAWFDGRLYTAIVPLPYSAEVLASKARDMLGRFGYPETPVDSGYGFRTSLTYMDWRDKNDKSDMSPARWHGLAAVREPPARFWYRTSPRRMVPANFLNGSSGAVLQASDPPLIETGMTYISTDLGGRLNYLEVVLPDRQVATPSPAAAPDWSGLFADAGLDPSIFRSVPAVYRVAAAADARAAWLGPAADAQGRELRVEAAFYRGRPVFFAQFGPWDEPADGPAASAALHGADLMATIVGLGVLGFAGLLAFRNARSGRADAKGATRLAIVLGLITITAGMLQSHLKFTSEYQNFALASIVGSWAAFTALSTWTLYMALEPYARRRWPQMLVSWNRLLEGRWRDPLVGRDLLVGGVCGLAMTLLGELTGYFTSPPDQPIFAAESWMGLGHVLAIVPTTVSQSVLSAFGMLLVLVALRIIVRREWVAILAVGLVMTAFGVLLQRPTTEVVSMGVTTMAFLLVATRFGLVALCATQVISRLFFLYGVSLTPAAPLMGANAAVLVAVVAPALFGFWMSRQRPTATAGGWLE